MEINTLSTPPLSRKYIHKPDIIFPYLNTHVIADIVDNKNSNVLTVQFVLLVTCRSYPIRGIEGTKNPHDHKQQNDAGNSPFSLLYFYNPAGNSRLLV